MLTGSKLFTVKIIHKRGPNSSPIIEGFSIVKIIGIMFTPLSPSSKSALYIQVINLILVYVVVSSTFNCFNAFMFILNVYKE